MTLPCWRQIDKPLLDGFGRGPEAASIDHFTIFVELAVMAPDITKVDTDRHLNPGPPAWNFRDEMMRRLFHGDSLSPIRMTCSLENNHLRSLWLQRDTEAKAL
jgi:hypothetical protein